MQLPSNMILTRVRPSLYIPLWVCVWSCISAATAAAHSYTHLIVIRFFLGIAEAPFFPGVFYLLSCWYTRKELAMRTAVLYSGLVLATAFSGLIAAGVFAGLDGAKGIAGWKWLFIIEGCSSFLFGIGAVFVLPDFPESPSGSAKWLFTEEERLVAVERMKRDRVSNSEGSRSVWYGLKLACMDYKTWIFVSFDVVQFEEMVLTLRLLGRYAHCKPHSLRIQLFLSLNCKRVQYRLNYRFPRPHSSTVFTRNCFCFGLRLF